MENADVQTELVVVERRVMDLVLVMLKSLRSNFREQRSCNWRAWRNRSLRALGSRIRHCKSNLSLWRVAARENECGFPGIFFLGTCCFVFELSLVFLRVPY